MGLLVPTSLCFLACLSLGPCQITALQICGSELANLLTWVCTQRGGFHAPIVRRSAPPLFKREAYYLLRGPEYRRSMDLPSGRIVDECCRRECTVSTLESYCAEPQNQEDPLRPLLRPEATVMHHKQSHQQQAVVTSESTQELSESDSRLEEPVVSSPRRPNIGMFSRNRPFFYVVSPPLHQDVEDLIADMLQ